MLARALCSLARRADAVKLGAPATFTVRHAANGAEMPVPTEQDLKTKDVYTILAEMMHKQAGASKKQDALKADVKNVIKLMESDVSSELNFQGPLKDMLPKMARQAREELFKDLSQSEPLNKAQPALKNVMAELAAVGETSRIVEVAYRYLAIVEGRTSTAAKPQRITITTATKEKPADLDAKKAMLLADMQGKGMLGKEQKVEWVTAVDPSIRGGVVYTIGDVMVDASYKALQEQFFQSLADAGVKRVP